MNSRRHDIQGLRALAVIAVILDHVIGWPLGGFAGVDVFFVISGFLITGLLIRDAAAGTLSLRRFYAKRMRRIAPAAITVLVVTTALAWLLFNQPRFWSTAWDAVSALFFVSNWRFAAEGTDYFRQGDAVSPLQHFWSLSVEEQFYLVWPVLVVLLIALVGRRASGTPVRRQRWMLGAALAVLAAASFGVALWQSTENPTVAYFSTLTRVWELAFGGLLAVTAPLFARLPTAVRAVLGWLGLGGIVASLLLVDSTMAFPGPWAAPAVIATAAVIVAGIGGRQPWLFPLENPVSRFLGDISYSLYLWHFPVLVFVLLLVPEQSLTVTIAVLALTLAVSLVAYFLIEQPLHRSPWLRGRELLETPAPAEPEPDRVQDARAAAPAEPAPLDPAPAPAPAPAPSREAPRAAPVARAGSPVSDRVRARALAAEAERARLRAELAASSSAPTAAPGRAAAAAAPASGTAQEAGASESGSAGGTERRRLRDARRSAWQGWRERFGAQFLGAGLGLVVIVVVVAVTVQLSVKGEGPLPLAVPSGVPAAGFGGDEHPEPAANGDGQTGDAAPVNPEDELQAELWNAASATEWPSNLSPSMDAAISETSSRNPAKGCFDLGGTPDFGRCTWGSGDAPNHMYLVGDSTALAYAPAFREIADRSGGQWKVTTVGLYGCRFTDVLVQNDGDGVMDSCPQRKADVAAQIAADAPQLVVVSNAYALGNAADRQPLTVAQLVGSTLSLASRFDTPGHVVYLAPPPLGANLGACYSPVKSPQDCTAGVDGAWNDFQKSFEAAVAAQGTGDHVVSSLGFTCVQGFCPAFAGTIPTRYDQVHMTPEYSVRVAESIRWELAAQGVM
ncbi:acyltransferase [Herbiconiux sp. VKM Ac-1786]|uniref:acyltransferase family protein n=1 Tax=Herbiconiux sp. VKM Ac-1786 TaxID=2783824 RepID=UPI00188A41D6|nr:acyltransferase family protein [Herbiconiux sp. VKM Ac-1786]MBF4573931.1 acyltransferase [Herbiconiux sp. VKM Ac-1786]